MVFADQSFRSRRFPMNPHGAVSIGTTEAGGSFRERSGSRDDV